MTSCLDHLVSGPSPGAIQPYWRPNRSTASSATARRVAAPDSSSSSAAMGSVHTSCAATGRHLSSPSHLPTKNPSPSLPRTAPRKLILHARTSYVTRPIGHHLSSLRPCDLATTFFAVASFFERFGCFWSFLAVRVGSRRVHNDDASVQELLRTRTFTCVMHTHTHTR